MMTTLHARYQSHSEIGKILLLLPDKQSNINTRQAKKICGSNLSKFTLEFEVAILHLPE